MNLAEIRKKAQKGESPAEKPVAAEPVSVSPEPQPEPEHHAQAQGLEPSETPEWRVPAVKDEPADSFWNPEPAGELAFPGFFAEDPDSFDPLAVILKGRESASSGEEGSPTDEQGTASLELLCFKVGSEEYAISIMDIKEIIKPREVTEVPRVPAFVRGILSLRGIIIPIFDMRLRLGLPAVGRSERERVVVVNRQNGFCGVLVDEVVQVVRIPEGGIEPPPVVLEGIDRDFVQGIGRVGGRMLILLDMEKVLDVGLL